MVLVASGRRTVKGRGVIPLLAVVLVLAIATGVHFTGKHREQDRDLSGNPPHTLWSPDPGSQWQWQLAGTPVIEPSIHIYGMDGQGTPKGVVQEFGQQGKRTICYISAGTLETWRPDAHRFPHDVVGEPVVGWDDEYWLDIREVDVLSSLMARRMDDCARKGFDAVEADNVDGYVHDTGFLLDPQDQIRYNIAMADLAHDRGLSIALKNDVGQIAQLEPYFDFAINESCFVYDECSAYAPFVESNKAVFNVEYQERLDRCQRAAQLGLSSMLKNRELDAWRKTC